MKYKSKNEELTSSTRARFSATGIAEELERFTHIMQRINYQPKSGTQVINSVSNLHNFQSMNQAK